MGTGPAAMGAEPAAMGTALTGLAGYVSSVRSEQFS